MYALISHFQLLGEEMRLIILLFLVFVFAGSGLFAQVDTGKSTLSYTLGRETLERVNVTRNTANLFNAQPVVGSPLDLGDGTIPVLGTAQWTYPGSPNKLDLFILGHVGDLDRAFYCTAEFTSRITQCRQINSVPGRVRFQISGGYRQNTQRGFLELVGGSDATHEFSQGFLWNISNETPGASFPFFTGADRTFPLNTISSTAVNKSVTHVFQIVFSSSSTSLFHIRKLNNLFRPTGPTQHFSFPQNILIASGSISNSIGFAAPGGPQQSRIYFAYRAFRNLPPLQSAVFVQVLDAKTLKAIGDAKTIVPFTASPLGNAELVQSVAIHPGAQYVAFSSYSPACNKEIVRIRALDANGNGRGPTRTAVPCGKVQSSANGANGIDITFRY
jgi:hypothetical protein